MNTRRSTTTTRDKGETPAKSVEDEILQALGGFTDALKKGEVFERFTCRKFKLKLVPMQYDHELVKETRRSLGLSQPLFARFLGVSPKAVRAWEQGVNTPPTMACRFMDEIRRNPSFWRKRVLEEVVSGDD